MLSTTVQYVLQNLNHYETVRYDELGDHEIGQILVDFMTDVVVMVVMWIFVQTQTYRNTMIQQYHAIEYVYESSDTDLCEFDEQIQHHLRVDISNRGYFAPRTNNP